MNSDVQGRSAREIVFDGKLKIGRFNAVDLFKDRLFFLLDALGYAIGHMCALARTTLNSFVFIGADACYYPSVLRPTKYLRLLESVLASLQSCCPKNVLQRLASSGLSLCSPIFTIANRLLFPDCKAAIETVENIHELNACKEVFVVLGHNNSLRSRIPMFPEMINNWKERKLRSKTR
jgi:peptidoglycan/xylan/chitin deacetylase (PgdA/CDA1 family)